MSVWHCGNMAIGENFPRDISLNGNFVVLGLESFCQLEFFLRAYVKSTSKNQLTKKVDMRLNPQLGKYILC